MDRFQITWRECFFGDPLPRLFKPSWFVKKTWLLGGGAYFPDKFYIENFKNLWTEFNVTLVTFYQDCSSPHDTSKNMATRGRGLFSLYIYIENFKILLVRNHLTDVNITWQECSFGDPLPSCSSCHDSSKNMAARGRGLFSLYSYIRRRL